MGRNRKREMLQVRMPRGDAEVLVGELADRVVDGEGELARDDSETHALFRIWKRTRDALGRLPHEWPETDGKIPRWARHR